MKMPPKLMLFLTFFDFCPCCMCQNWRFWDFFFAHSSGKTFQKLSEAWTLGYWGLVSAFLHLLPPMQLYPSPPPHLCSCHIRSSFGKNQTWAFPKKKTLSACFCMFNLFPPPLSHFPSFFVTGCLCPENQGGKGRVGGRDLHSWCSGFSNTGYHPYGRCDGAMPMPVSGRNISIWNWRHTSLGRCSGAKATSAALAAVELKLHPLLQKICRNVLNRFFVFLHRKFFGILIS